MRFLSPRRPWRRYWKVVGTVFLVKISASCRYVGMYWSLTVLSSCTCSRTAQTRTEVSMCLLRTKSTALWLQSLATFRELESESKSGAPGPLASLAHAASRPRHWHCPPDTGSRRGPWGRIGAGHGASGPGAALELAQLRRRVLGRAMCPDDRSFSGGPGRDQRTDAGLIERH